MSVQWIDLCLMKQDSPQRSGFLEIDVIVGNAEMVGCIEMPSILRSVQKSTSFFPCHQVIPSTINQRMTSVVFVSKSSLILPNW